MGSVFSKSSTWPEVPCCTSDPGGEGGALNRGRSSIPITITRTNAARVARETDNSGGYQRARRSTYLLTCAYCPILPPLHQIACHTTRPEIYCARPACCRIFNFARRAQANEYNAPRSRGLPSCLRLSLRSSGSRCPFGCCSLRVGGERRAKISLIRTHASIRQYPPSIWHREHRRRASKKPTGCVLLPSHFACG